MVHEQAYAIGTGCEGFDLAKLGLIVFNLVAVFLEAGVGGDHAEGTRIAYGGGKLGVGNPRHTGLDYWGLDIELFS
jgi:hypothetical protein